MWINQQAGRQESRVISNPKYAAIGLEINLSKINL